MHSSGWSEPSSAPTGIPPAPPGKELRRCFSLGDPAAGFLPPAPARDAQSHAGGRRGGVAELPPAGSALRTPRSPLRAPLRAATLLRAGTRRAPPSLLLSSPRLPSPLRPPPAAEWAALAAGCRQLSHGGGSRSRCEERAHPAAEDDSRGAGARLPRAGRGRRAAGELRGARTSLAILMLCISEKRAYSEGTRNAGQHLAKRVSPERFVGDREHNNTIRRLKQPE
ncbi:uncharacterized protein [Anser cygnoides]|uniref:uncharacterized protein n=1 Tax=Anser cygnoides TaxID=8845 RepID=UPI0034D1875B